MSENTKNETGMVIVLAMPEGLALKSLAERRGYSVPRKQTPWMEKEINGLTARVSRDDEKKLWTLRLQGDKVQAKKDLSRALEIVVADLVDTVAGLQAKGIFYFAQGALNENVLSQFDCKNKSVPIGGGTMQMTIKEESGQIHSAIMGKIVESSDLLFLANTLLHNVHLASGVPA